MNNATHAPRHCHIALRAHPAPTPPQTWQCDGCGATATTDQIRAAWPATPAMLAIDPDILGLHDCGDHWGWMLVGGPAWLAFTAGGRHPMLDVIDMVAGAYLRHVAEQNGLDLS